MDKQIILNLIDIYCNLTHSPHPAKNGTNTGCNDLDLLGSEHKSLVAYAVENLTQHSIRTQRLSKAALTTHVPSFTDPRMVRKLQSLGAYVTQIDIQLGEYLYQFQGISTSKRDSISLSYIVTLACINRLKASKSTHHC